MQDGDDLGSLIQTRPTFESVLASGCTGMMRGWLKRCKKEHKTCPKQDVQHELPTRLLDVGSSTSDPFLMVSNGRWGTWAALSHCWGRRLRIKTTNSNLNAHCEGFGLKLDELSPTFQDAVRITRELGIKYLWVDALCIIQGDTDDWEKEAKRMDYIYSNATVTIAAEASPDSTIGILRSMEQSRSPQSMRANSLCHSETKGLRGKLHFRIDDRKYKGRTSRGCLSTRAWTMQEEILSPRILRFAEQQVIWKCSEAYWSEWNPEHSELELWDFTDKLHNSLKNFPRLDSDYTIVPSDKQKQQLLIFWYMNVINYYIGRDITYKSDRLIAIEGIANEIRSRMVAIDYEAGIWYEDGHEHSADIHKGLTWSVPVGNARTNEQPYIAPSWSWAQLNVSGASEFGQHNFVYNISLLESLTPLTDTINVTSYVVNPSTTSSVTTAKSSKRSLLKVQGRCLEVCSHIVPSPFLDERAPDPDRDYYYKFDRIREKHNSNLNLIGLKALMDRKCTAIGKQEGHRRYMYLQIGRWEPHQWDDRSTPVIVALILEEIGTKLEMFYRRVGRALITVDPELEIEPWSTQSVSIL